MLKNKSPAPDLRHKSKSPSNFKPYTQDFQLPQSMFTTQTDDFRQSTSRETHLKKRNFKDTISINDEADRKDTHIPDIIIPDLETMYEAPSLLENFGGVTINRNGEGTYRRRPNNEALPSKMISARVNNSVHMPENVDNIFIPKYRADGSEKIQSVYLASKHVREEALDERDIEENLTPMKDIIIAQMGSALKEFTITEKNNSVNKTTKASMQSREMDTTTTTKSLAINKHRRNSFNVAVTEAMKINS